MNLLATAPPLARIIIIFAFILALSKFKCNLGAALLMGSFLLALWFGLAIIQTVQLIVLSLLSSQAMALLAIVGLILALSRIMEKCGQMGRIVNSFGSMLKSYRLSLAAMPALIGLLPMLGGAVFSAPMVDTIASGSKNISPSQKSVINYWFRHIWEYWWPLYPGVILAVSLTGIELSRFITVQLIFTLAALLGGYLFILLPIRKINPTEMPSPVSLEGNNFLWEALPIIIIILVVIFSGLSFLVIKSFTDLELIFSWNTSIILGLFISLIWVIASNRVDRRTIKESILNKTIYSMLFLIAGIVVFEEIIRHSGAIVGIRENLTSLNIPLPVIAALLPLASGIVTGITVGFVGPSFPIIVELVNTSGAGSEILPYAVLAYGFGFMGVMLSPVHLCFILTKDFFCTDMGKVYKRLFLPCLTVLIFAVLMFWLLKLIL